MERTITVPIEYCNVPEPFAAEVARYPDAQVTLRGSPRAFRLHDTSEIEVALDASGLARGATEFTLGPNDVRHPADLRVMHVQPGRIRFAGHSDAVSSTRRPSKA